jgi:hypothetical protein
MAKDRFVLAARIRERVRQNGHSIEGLIRIDGFRQSDVVRCSPASIEGRRPKRIAIRFMLRCKVPLSLLFFPLASFAAEPDKDALAIVVKAIEAHGAEKLGKAQAQSWKRKGKLILADMTVEYKADYTFAGPDKFRFDVDMEAGGMKIKFSVGTNGKAAWEQSGPELRDMPKVDEKLFAKPAK